MPRTRCLSLSAVVALVLILALPCLVAADTTISTVAEWDGTTGQGSFGHGGASPNYGQTITVPAGETSLESFTFYMNMPATVVFRGEVYAWDGDSATGTSLWESDPMSTSGSGGYEAITFNTGGISVTPGAQYVLFATTTLDVGSSGGNWGKHQNQDVYDGGEFVFLNDESWTTSTWTTDWGGLNADLVFEAVFSSGAQPTPSPPPSPTPPPEVPEPGSLLLLASGLAGLGGFGALRARLKGNKR